MNYNRIKKCVQQLLISIMLVSFCTINSQNTNNSESKSQDKVNKDFQAGHKKLGTVAYFSNAFKKVQGSVYLFKDWKHKAILYTLDNQEVLLNSVNLNVQSNYFESKIYRDSVLQFDFDKIQKVIVDGRTYKQLDFNGSAKIFELVYESNSFVLLKGFNIQVLYGSPNPMLNSPNDKYIQRKSYYLKKGMTIQSFKPTRKRLINLFNGDETRAAILESHIKKEGSVNPVEQAKRKFIKSVNKIGIFVFESSENNFKGVRKTVGGTKYLFDDWNNRAFIYTTKGKKIALNNMNLDLRGNIFVAKVASNSIYTFSFKNIEKVVIRNKIFKKYYYNDAKNVFEVLHETDRFSLLKGHSVELVYGSPNPMLNKKDKFIRKTNYFVKKDNKIKPFKLRKKNVMELASIREEKMDEIATFISTNNLSYKKESDVLRILEFNSI